MRSSRRSRGCAACLAWTAALPRAPAAPAASAASAATSRAHRPRAQIFESELAKAQSDPSGSAAIAAVQAEWTSAVEGSDGLLELAAKEEKAAEAGLLQCITDMEKLEVDVQGVAEVTIGEILDREPELRAEIEEEIKNNVWAP